MKQEAKLPYLLECLQKTAPPVLIFAENKVPAHSGSPDSSDAPCFAFRTCSGTFRRPLSSCSPSQAHFPGLFSAYLVFCLRQTGGRGRHTRAAADDGGGGGVGARRQRSGGAGGGHPAVQGRQKGTQLYLNIVLMFMNSTALTKAQRARRRPVSCSRPARRYAVEMQLQLNMVLVSPKRKTDQGVRRRHPAVPGR